ncbi:conserved virulence factor C family protein [Alkalicoccobacillus gibsonii]|uniref:conserved virulence factor C family protein n=1 Tax=Alkalicoccobacillus gibsonii TaxID=79881 RepID=UPI001931AF32|nr:conserved virulence factor C family protein [Alkalicoccobacillus gibsonii]MBM0064703.1 conserved virulence factor C family protein [Alkalicoccobacillus gibsonii]
MKIISIEPTPSPNTMKLIVSEHLKGGSKNTYNKSNYEDAPEVIKEMFKIEGVKSVYHVADFLAIDRHPKVDWKTILPKVREVFGEEGKADSDQQASLDGFGEVTVQLQLFKGIPMQIKLTDGEQEVRQGLPDRFAQAVATAQKPEDNVVMERKWQDHGVRYGDLQTIATDVADEVSAAYSDKRLDALVKQATSTDEAGSTAFLDRYKVTLEMLDVEDWRERYAALDQMDPKPSDLPVLEKALRDEKASIRRLAVVYIGMLEEEEILPYLVEALNDPSITVRRTAGDCVSDLGDPAATPAMIESLQDKSKLVRWRAAMFLYEEGDETAIEALKKAESDPEFEVALQAKMALERIEGGEEAKGSVWKQMTEARNQ